MRKSILIFGCLFALLFVLSACKKTAEPAANIEFTAEINKLYDSSMLVFTTDDVGFAEAVVNIADIEPQFNLVVGQTVKITILPEILESDPVQVTAVSIELVEDTVLVGKITPNGNESEIVGVSMSIVAGSVTSKGLSVIIMDTNEAHYLYDGWYKLMRYNGSAWEDIPVELDQEPFFSAIGVEPDEDGLLLALDWDWLYGELDRGEYKIVKSLYFVDGYKYFSAGFEIA